MYCNINYYLHKLFLIIFGEKITVVAEKNVYYKEENFAPQYLICKGNYNGQIKEFKSEAIYKNLSYFIGEEFTVYVNKFEEEDDYLVCLNMRKMKQIVRKKKLEQEQV